MKKTLLTLLFSSLFISSALAGHPDKASHHERFFNPLDRLTKKLDLTKEQQDALKALREKWQTENKANQQKLPQEDTLKQLVQADSLDENLLEQLAESFAQENKTRFISRVRHEQAIWAILNTEQRNEVKRMLDNHPRMKRNNDEDDKHERKYKKEKRKENQN